MMKNKIACVAVLIFVSATVVSAQATKVTIVEVKQSAPAAPAPRECQAAFREFFLFLQKDYSGIIQDKQAQNRWLTQELRKALAQKLSTFSSPKDDPDYPSSNTFIGAWDRPSTYAIISSRRYGKRAVIDVLYKWGPNTNYQGDERTTSFIFLLEDGAWKLDDVYTFRGKFVPAESLSQYLLEK